jgi:hypothetical protein
MTAETVSSPRYAIKAFEGLKAYQVGREAIITIQPATGYVAVSCPWHAELNGCHWWSHRGDQSLRDFLMKINRDYTIGKLFGQNDTKEFDQERTAAELKRWIIEARREARACPRRGLTDSAARDHWSEVEGIETEEEVAALTWLEEPWSYIVRRPKPCIDWFWNEVWASFIAHLRTEPA